MMIRENGYVVVGRTYENSSGTPAVVLFNNVGDVIWEDTDKHDVQADRSFAESVVADGGETKDKVKAGKTGVGQSGKSVAKNSELLAYILATTAVTAFAVMLVVRRFNAEER